VHEHRKMDRVQRASRNTLTMQIHPQKEWGAHTHTHTQKSPHFGPKKSILLGHRTSPPPYDLPHLHWTQLKYTQTHINSHIHKLTYTDNTYARPACFSLGVLESTSFIFSSFFQSFFFGFGVFNRGLYLALALSIHNKQHTGTAVREGA
jgi:hypothetical protein